MSDSLLKIHSQPYIFLLEMKIKNFVFTSRINIGAWLYIFDIDF